MGLDLPPLDRCPFCEYIAGTRPCSFVTRGGSVSTIMNRTQYERGALLVLPNAHVESVLDADERLLCDVYREARRVARALVDVFAATGINVFQNSGVSAGQTVPHYHVHVVPRYPDSDSGRRFREADYAATELAELDELARVLRAALRVT